ncbi:MAG: Redox-sensing transcriptional repressor Rex, partial [uncultured Frankineae bacterium]
ASSVERAVRSATPVRRPGGDRRPTAGLPACAARAGRRRLEHRLERGAGGRGRGGLGEAAQGPVLPRLLRHPRRRLRRRRAGPARQRRPGPGPALARRPGRRRQPRARAGRLRRVRRAGLLRRGAVRRRPGAGGGAGRRAGRAPPRRARRRGAQRPRVDRRHHDARLGGAGRLRPAGGGGHHQRPELRAGAAAGARRRRRAQGRPVQRAADPVLPRAPQGRPRAHRGSGV